MSPRPAGGRWGRLAGAEFFTVEVLSRRGLVTYKRGVRPAKQACLSRLILFGGAPSVAGLGEFGVHYHSERNHQGKGKKLLVPEARDEPKQLSIAAGSAAY